MKKKITVKGISVQDVAYRLFLLDRAETESIRELDVKNDIKDKKLVEIYIGDNDVNKVEKFIEWATDNFPENAEIDSENIVIDEWRGNIKTIESFSRSLSTNQLYKIANTGVSMLKEIGKMTKDTNQNFDRMDKKYDKISQKMESIDSSIKDLANAIRTFAEALTTKNLEKKK